jgi:heme/copper-type cytochrome/quinol oxidase subunit 1
MRLCTPLPLAASVVTKGSGVASGAHEIACARAGNAWSTLLLIMKLGAFLGGSGVFYNTLNMIYREIWKKWPASRKQNKVQSHTQATKQGYATQSEAEQKTHILGANQAILQFPRCFHRLMASVKHMILVQHGSLESPRLPFQD